MSRPLVVDPIQDPLVAARASRTVRWYVPPADSATRAPEWRPIERAGEAGESAQAPAMPEEPPPETGLSLDEIDLATFAARARAAGRRDGLAAAAEHTERRLADALDPKLGPEVPRGQRPAGRRDERRAARSGASRLAGKLAKKRT